MRRRTFLNVARMLVLAALVSACATPQTTPSAAVTTLEPAASRWFKLDWTAQPDGNDARREYTLAPVPGFGRSYFNIGRLAAADHYQVTVWSAYFYQGRRLGRLGGP